MTYSFSISTRKGDEYRIMLFDVDLSLGDIGDWCLGMLKAEILRPTPSPLRLALDASSGPSDGSSVLRGLLTATRLCKHSDGSLNTLGRLAKKVIRK